MLRTRTKHATHPFPEKKTKGNVRIKKEGSWGAQSTRSFFLIEAGSLGAVLLHLIFGFAPEVDVRRFVGHLDFGRAQAGSYLLDVGAVGVDEVLGKAEADGAGRHGVGEVGPRGETLSRKLTEAVLGLLVLSGWDVVQRGVKRAGRPLPAAAADANGLEHEVLAGLAHVTAEDFVELERLQENARSADQHLPCEVKGQTRLRERCSGFRPVVVEEGDVLVPGAALTVRRGYTCRSIT